MDPLALKEATKPQKLWITTVVDVNAAIGACAACANLTADRVRAEAGRSGVPANATRTNAGDTASPVQAGFRLSNLMVPPRLGGCGAATCRRGESRSDDRRLVLQTG